MNREVRRWMLCCAVFVTLTTVGAKERIKVACVGNSITYGYGADITDRARQAYPAVLGAYLGAAYEVRNFGVSSRTLLMKGDKPYRKEETFREALRFEPDIVIIKLGTNDSKPFNWVHKGEFASDMDSLIADFDVLKSKPRIYIGTPAYVAKDRFGITQKVVAEEVVPLVRECAERHGLTVIDFHSALFGKAELYGDGVHPTAAGARVMAQTAYEVIVGK